MTATRSCIFILASLLVVSLAPAAAQELSKEHSNAQDAGRKYTEMFYASDLKALHDMFTDDMKAAMSFDAFVEVRRQLGLQLGDQQETLGEKVTVQDAYVVYTRRANFEKYPGVIEVRWVLSGDHKIAGVFMSPEAPAPTQKQP